MRLSMREEVEGKLKTLCFLFQICEWREEGKAAVIPGVLFIDEVRILHLIATVTFHFCLVGEVFLEHLIWCSFW